MEDLSLHILDIAENATRAGATFIEIIILEDTEENRLQITVKDNGRGMDPDMLSKITDPFMTTRTTRNVGLGVPLLEQAAKESGGSLSVRSQSGEGTVITASFQADHIDRKPLGDMASTFISLVAGNPDTDFLYKADFDGDEIVVDTRQIRRELDGVAPMNDPAVLRILRDLLTKD